MSSTRATALASTILLLAADAAAQPAPPRAKEPEPIHLAIGAHLGGAYRADEPAAFQADQRGGLVLGASALVWIRTWIGAGLAYEHTDLGREHSGVGPTGVVNVERDLSTLWASLRVAPLATEAIAVYLAFGPGFSWQSADATGLAFSGPNASAPIPFQCEGNDSLGLALRGGAGVEGRLGAPGLVLFAEATIDAHRLSSEPLGACVPGAGTATMLGARAGAAYRFDVARFVR